MLRNPLVFALGNLALVKCTTPAPYEISVDPSLIDEAITKASLYRPSLDLLENTDWLEGAPAVNMTALADYWANDYDWFKVQDELNANGSHYFVTVPGGRGYDRPVPLHFVHERSSRADAIPLLMLHGWPSTHTEWSKVIGPLASPDNSTAFHVVAPDFPGFGFSPAPTHPGFGPREAGLAYSNLMKSLGYEKYGIVSTDAGWWTGMWMVDDEADEVIGHFTDFYFAQPNATDVARYQNGEMDEIETPYIAAALAFQNEFAAYMTIQSQGPLKLAQAMNDSPVGFAGWIWHLIHIACDGHVFTLEEVITRTLMLWIPGAYGNIRTYKEWLIPANNVFPESDVPTGVGQWGSRNAPFQQLALLPVAPRSWIERISNLTFIVTRDFGGHFPAEHYPDLYVQDLRAFFSSLV